MTAAKPIALTIDGKSCAGPAGQTILEIASANGVVIPTLCYLKHLSPWGGCRMCIVEVQGSPKVVPSCSTPAVEGSVVSTRTARLQHLRRVTLELLFSERNHICPFCPTNKGDCELQLQGYRHGLDSIRFPYLYPSLPLDVSGRFFGLDHNRCILCTRCVRTCDEIEGVHTLDISHRGSNNRVVVDLGREFGASDTCTLCGACVAACPTGALFDKAAAFRGALRSCETVRTTCLECPVGCGLLVYRKENRIVDVFGDPDSAINAGHLCVRGRYEIWAEPRDRLLRPMIRDNGSLRPATWEEAARVIAGASNDLRPAQRALLVSPRLTNETAEALGRIAPQFAGRGMFVAANESALWEAGSRATGNGSVADALSEADAVILLGTQPSATHGVIAARIRVAVRKRGARLLIFHCRKSDLDSYADLCAHVVSLERAFWERAAALLRGLQRPVLVYGPNAMTPVGVTVMERLMAAFGSGAGEGRLRTIELPVSVNAQALAATGLEPLEDIGPWLDERALKFLQIVAGDEPDGGARLIEEKHVPALLEAVGCVVVQASYRSRLLDYAKVVLPATVWCEKSGTVTNLEGRTLELHRVLEPRGEARDDRAILEALYS